MNNEDIKIDLASGVLQMKKLASELENQYINQSTNEEIIATCLEIKLLSVFLKNCFNTLG